MASYGAQLLLSCLAIGLLFQDVTLWSFSPLSEPVILTLDPNTTHQGSFSVMCQADTPLVKCQFNMYPQEGHADYPLVDLSQGSNTGVITRKDHPKDTLLFDVSYDGTGLENGQCGATFRNVFLVAYHFVCRGADAVGEWHDMDFTVMDQTCRFCPRFPPGILVASINPKRVIVTPGSDVSMLLKTNATMGRCALLFELKSDPPIVYFKANELQTLPVHYRYYGTSPLNGECGITIVNVTEADNGPISHVGITEDIILVHRISTVIVAAPPTDTIFNVDKLTYSVGDTLKATCSSLLSRPVANLTWTLDDRIIRQDTINDEFQEDVWSWSWVKANITQTISLNLGEEHFGKNLECKVQHLALTEIRPQLHYLITKT